MKDRPRNLSLIFLVSIHSFASLNTATQTTYMTKKTSNPDLIYRQTPIVFSPRHRIRQLHHQSAHYATPKASPSCPKALLVATVTTLLQGRKPDGWTDGRTDRRTDGQGKISARAVFLVSWGMFMSRVLNMSFLQHCRDKRNDW